MNYERQIIARILFGNSSSIYIKNRPKYVIDSETVYVHHKNTVRKVEFSTLKYQKHQIMRTFSKLKIIKSKL